jgi:hypothetical protein
MSLTGRYETERPSVSLRPISGPSTPNRSVRKAAIRMARLSMRGVDDSRGASMEVNRTLTSQLRYILGPRPGATQLSLCQLGRCGRSGRVGNDGRYQKSARE